MWRRLTCRVAQDLGVLGQSSRSFDSQFAWVSTTALAARIEPLASPWLRVAAFHGIKRGPEYRSTPSHHNTRFGTCAYYHSGKGRNAYASYGNTRRYLLSTQEAEAFLKHLVTHSADCSSFIQTNTVDGYVVGVVSDDRQRVPVMYVLRCKRGH